MLCYSVSVCLAESLRSNEELYCRVRRLPPIEQAHIYLSVLRPLGTITPHSAREVTKRLPSRHAKEKRPLGVLCPSLTPSFSLSLLEKCVPAGCRTFGSRRGTHVSRLRSPAQNMALQLHNQEARRKYRLSPASGLNIAAPSCLSWCPLARLCVCPTIERGSVGIFRQNPPSLRMSARHPFEARPAAEVRSV